LSSGCHALQAIRLQPPAINPGMGSDSRLSRAGKPMIAKMDG
jgi:hypothetical protein